MPSHCDQQQSRPMPMQQRFVATFLLLFLMSNPGQVFSQANADGSSTNSFRIPYEERYIPLATRQPADTKLSRQLTKKEISQLAETRGMAFALAQKGSESFRRGLLPLGDYLRQLSLSESLRRNVSSFGVGETRRTIVLSNRETYRNIVRELEQFQQPAAEGWASDLALGHIYLARAEAEAAYVLGERADTQAALKSQVEWSNRLLRSREFDEVLGMASPRASIDAAQLERRAALDAQSKSPSPGEYQTAFQDYRDQLEGVTRSVEKWSEQGAGIGRIDRVQHSRFELAQADALLEMLKGNPAGQRTALKTAETELSNLYESQLGFYSQGTADIFDLAKTWSDRQMVYDQAADMKGFQSPESAALHDKQYKQLQTFANDTRDRRGRIAADVEFISALDEERKLVALRKSITDPFRTNVPYEGR